MTTSKKKTKLQKEVYERLYRVGPVTACETINQLAWDAKDRVLDAHTHNWKQNWNRQIRCSDEMRNALWAAKKSIDSQSELSESYLKYLLEVKLKNIFRDVRLVSHLNIKLEKTLVDSL